MMSETGRRATFARMRPISGPDEAYEAAGFVMDCILRDGGEGDGYLGNQAGLRPFAIARADDGSIQSVLCTVRPCDPNDLLRESREGEEQVLVSAC